MNYCNNNNNNLFTEIVIFTGCESADADAAE